MDSPCLVGPFFWRNVEIPHSAFMDDDDWKLWVMFKGDTEANWQDILEVLPEAKLTVKKTTVIVQIPEKDISSPTSFVVVGSHGPGSHKRMQVTVFGTKPVLGKDWSINACLVDDDQNALKVSRYTHHTTSCAT